MSFTIQQLISFTARVGGGQLAGHQGPDSGAPAQTIDTVMSGDEYAVLRQTIAAGAAGVLWATAATQITTFSVAWFKSSKDCWLRLRNAGTGSVTLKVKANVPLPLSSDDIGNAFTDAAIAAAPTSVNIDEISVFNPSADAADVALYLFA